MRFQRQPKRGRERTRRRKLTSDGLILLSAAALPFLSKLRKEARVRAHPANFTAADSPLPTRRFRLRRSLCVSCKKLLPVMPTLDAETH